MIAKANSSERAQRVAQRKQFAMLSRLGKRNERAMSKRLLAVLRGQVEELAQSVRRGPVRRSATQLLAEHAHAWEKSLDDAKQPWALAYSVQGYKVAGAFTGRKSWAAEFALGKATAETVSTSFFGADELVANHLRARVGSWIARTSKIETKTTADALEALYLDAFGQLEAEDALTAEELADAILDAGLAAVRPRANLLARTMTNWAYNEGAEASYEDAGIQAKEWMVTEDDATCDLCAPMAGQTVSLGASFLGAGNTFEGNNDARYTPEFDIAHPPLHPNCRCVLLPVVLT